MYDLAISMLVSVVSIFQKLPVWLFVLGVLIFVHELGHFLVAKMCGVGVVEFSIGFGKKIWSKRFGETRYSIGLIPLGGYVKMVGDDFRKVYLNESHDNKNIEEDSNDTQLKNELQEKLKVEEIALSNDRNRWFLTKPYFQKFAIVFAGPLFNLFFAFVLAVFSITYFGKQMIDERAVIGDVLPQLPAEKAGIKSGDLVLSINGEQVNDWFTMSKLITQYSNSAPSQGANEQTDGDNKTPSGAPVVLKIKRYDNPNNLEFDDVFKSNGPSRELEVSLIPTYDRSDLAVIEGRDTEKRFIIGIIPNSHNVEASLFDGIKLSAYHIFRISYLNIITIVKMLTRKVSSEVISGPIFIFQEAGNKAKKGAESLMEFMIVLSISLAVLNLLPIPILDGGHLVFFTIEKIIGRPVSLRVQEFANQVGIFLLLLLMVFAVGNDISRLINPR
jgi:regulator of sigma E protease